MIKITLVDIDYYGHIPVSFNLHCTKLKALSSLCIWDIIKIIRND